MTNQPVTVSIKQGPIIIRSLQGKALFNEINLWDGIKGKEEFPGTTKSDYYILTLFKNVSDYLLVPKIENELIDVLEWFSKVWEFSGGSFFIIDRKETRCFTVYESNANEVGKDLMRQAGRSLGRSSLQCSYQRIFEYENPPLYKASMLVKKAKSDENLKKIFQYFYKSRLDKRSWFVDLYKIREILSYIYGSQKNAKQALNISNAKWRKYGTSLNENDRRHVSTNSQRTNVIPLNKSKLESYAKEWILSYLRERGLL